MTYEEHNYSHKSPFDYGDVLTKNTEEIMKSIMGALNAYLNTISRDIENKVVFNINIHFNMKEYNINAPAALINGDNSPIIGSHIEQKNFNPSINKED